MSDISKLDSNFAIVTKVDKKDIKFYNIDEAPFKIYGVFRENGKYRRMPESVAKSVYNELQAGSYLFMDSTYGDLNLPFKNSLFALSTVVSSKDGLTVVDAGVKTCGIDQGMPLVYDNVAENIVASEEHFQLHGLHKPLKVGDNVKLIPGHCCSTVNLHDKIYVVEEGKVVGRLLITARGMGR